MRATLTLALAALGPITTVQAAQAAQAPAAVDAAIAQADSVGYDAAFFSAFAPRTALDMIKRVPGFSLDEGDGRRGFSGSGGNVLIDGARPSTKSQDLEDVLSRIPAAQVLRIEVLRNAGGDAQGQGLVANVIRAGGSGGTWRVEGVQNSDGRVAPRGEAAITSRIGGADVNFGIQRYIEVNPLAGWRILTDGAGRPTSRRSDETPRSWRELKANGEAKLRVAGGDLRINASAGRWNFKPWLESQGLDLAGNRTESNRLQIDERERRREIGADWTRVFGDTTLKLLALDTRRWYASDDATLFRNAAGVQTGLVAQRRRNDGVEQIGRAALTRSIGKHALEFSLEGALNSLDTDVDFSRDGVPIVLPAGDVFIEEKRTEAQIADVWSVTPRWTIEARLAGERSTLTQSGDTTAEATFEFVKPSLQVARKIGENDEIRVRLARDVGQLNFGDFASSATLADDRVAAGNPNLAPDSRWRLEAALDKRFGADGALSITVFREEISDVQDLVPVGGFDAPGNLGDGRITGVDVNATLPLSDIADGLALTLDGNYGRSRVVDPLTKRERRLSEFTDYHVFAELRRDDRPRKLAYGLTYDKTSERQFYRVGEIETYEEGALINAYLETTAVKGVKIRATASNLGNKWFHRERFFFAPDRRSALASTETRDRQFGRFYGISVSGTF